MLREIYAVLKKELRQARRDPRFLGPSIIVPIAIILVYMVLLPTVGGGESFVVGLVVNDSSPQAEDMAAIIGNMTSTTNHTWFTVERHSLEEAESQLQSGGLIAYIVIPSGFGQNITAGEKARIVIHINNVNDDVVKNYVHRVETAILLFNQHAYAPDFDQSNASVAIDETLTLPTTPSLIHYTGASAILLSVIVCSIGGQAMLAAADIESGAFYETLGSPTPRVALIIGRTIAAIPRSMLGLIFVIPFISLSLGLPITANLLLLCGVIVLTILGTAPLGEIIGNAVGNREQSLLVSVILTVLGYFAGGGIAPVSILPQPYRLVTLLSPMTYAIDLWIRTFFTVPLGIAFVPSVALVLWWIVLTVVAAILLSRRLVE